MSWAKQIGEEFGRTALPGRRPPDGPEGPSYGEAARDRRHPISRFYVQPLAQLVAAVLCGTRVRPWQVTLLGTALAAGAAAVLVAGGSLFWAALFVWLAWLCDRVDGKLARLQGTSSKLGAWLDANLDELSDVGLHAAVAWRLFVSPGEIGMVAPWLFAAFVAGKYLFLHGTWTEPKVAVSLRETKRESTVSRRVTEADHAEHDGCATLHHAERDGYGRDGYGRDGYVARLRRAALGLFRLPGNADVRLHVLLAALLSGFLLTELTAVAGYYLVRWLARLAIAPRRMAGSADRLGGPP
ncbi:MAG: CDP-alcohol phosphatidyltransferase family protein [Planctomycetia bacterium]|nr:CDP-alcohol phosphatidyltransferase family protein [Planctomycetia bacterium]